MNRSPTQKFHYYKHKLYRKLKRWRGRILDGLNWYGDLSLSKIQPVFLVSTGRTGTTFLANLFAGFSGVTAFHEPQPDFSDMGVYYARGQVPGQTVKNHLKSNRLWAFNQTLEQGSSIYFEANHFLFSLPALLDKLFPSAQFIHVIRDGRDMIRSGHAKGYFLADDMYDRPKASDFPEDPFYDEWEQFSRFQKICWYWKFKDQTIAEKLESCSNVLTVYFEDIFDSDNGHPGMKEILSYLEIDPPGWQQNMGNKKRSTGEYTLPHWTEWSPQQKKQFKQIAGDHLRRHKYSWENSSSSPRTDWSNQ